jgi:hypothetical protein
MFSTLSEKLISISYLDRKQINSIGSRTLLLNPVLFLLFPHYVTVLIYVVKNVAFKTKNVCIFRLIHNLKSSSLILEKVNKIYLIFWSGLILKAAWSTMLL